ncbi:MAG: Holliday junction branch migration protein RuvA [Bacteroidetes bacterium]|nr:Holliday junction branch migration protein RuvA [Bacteroidota bacterium]MCY4205608.1 Holliday junction branch migration protein RuvA [Bacteroidota bacterium]
MIEHIEGILSGKGPAHAVIDVHGVGYRVFIPMSTSDKLPETGKKIRLLIHHYTREDREHLFGFFSSGERAIFELFLGVSGIGPRIAVAALSTLSPEELVKHITLRQPGMLQRISGVGRKTAERIVVELSDRIKDLDLAETEGSSAAIARSDALSALETLGLSRAKAEQLLRKVMRDHPNVNTAEEFVQLALSQ